MKITTDSGKTYEISFSAISGLSPARKVKIIAVLIGLSNIVLSIGDRIHTMPFVPGWAVHFWPQVLGASVFVHQMASVLFPDQQGASPEELKKLIQEEAQKLVSGSSPLPQSPTKPTT